jgi:hypothetical protein
MSSSVDNTTDVSVTSSSSAAAPDATTYLGNNSTIDSVRLAAKTVDLMGATPAEIDHVFQRKVLVVSQPLSTTDIFLADQLSGLDIFSVYFANAMVLRKITGFEFFKGTLKITATITAPAGSYGAYNLIAYPYPWISNTTSPVSRPVPVGQMLGNGPDPFTSFQGVHSLIDIGQSNVVEIELPALGVADAFPLDITANASSVGGWRLSLFALSPVTSANSATAIAATFNLYAEMLPDFVMFNNIPQGKTHKEQDHPPRRKPSEFGQAVSAGISNLGAAIPILAPFTAPVAAGLAAVSSLASIFGFTRTSQPAENTPMTIRGLENIANCDGADTSEVTALMVGNTLSIDNTLRFGTEEDVMANESLFQRWTMIANFPWATTDAAGTVLFSFPVTPSYFSNILGVMYPTVAGYVGLPFTYWRGDMEYMFYIPVSAFHRGRLQIVWSNSNNYQTFTTRTEILNNAIIDVETSHSFTTTIGYNRHVPALENVIYTPSIAGRQNTDVLPESSNGFLAICVANVLQNMTQTIASTVRIIVLARAAPNMKFMVPKHSDRATNLANKVVFASQYKYQGGIGQEDSGNEEVPIIPRSGDYPLAEVCCGESFESIRALIQKFSPVYSQQSTTAAGKRVIVMRHFPTTSGFAPILNSIISQRTPSSNVPVPSPLFQWYVHYSLMFAGQAGSIRYKCVLNHNATGTNITGGDLVMAHWSDAYTPIGTVDYDPFSPTFAQQAMTNHVTMQKGVDNTTLNVTSPYYHRYKFCMVNPSTNLGGATDQPNQFDYFYADRAGPNDFTIWAAGGPDTSFVAFYRTPRLLFNA